MELLGFVGVLCSLEHSMKTEDKPVKKDLECNCDKVRDGSCPEHPWRTKRWWAEKESTK
jgi:hypothetical protein